MQRLPTFRVLFFASLVAGCGGGLDATDAGDASEMDSTTDATTSDVVDATLDVGIDSPADSGADAVEAASPVDASGCVDYDAKQPACSTLTPCPIVNVGCANVPPAAGGTIVDGYYLLTSAVYNSAKNDGGCYANQTRKDTIEVCGNVMLWLDIDTVNSSYEAALTFTTNGSDLTTKSFCFGGGSGGTFPYTATATTLTIYFDYSQTNELVLTLTKQ